MSTSLLYPIQGIRGFQFLNFKYKPKTVIAEICKKHNKFKCSNCNSSNVTATFIKKRLVKGLPIGSSHFYINVQVHRLKCKNCNAFLTEDIDFLSSQKSHYTKQLEQAVIEQRPEMTIQALAMYFNLHWSTVKDIEKKHLCKKYSRVKLKNVSFIGIDEIHMGLNGFLTIVIQFTAIWVLPVY